MSDGTLKWLTLLTAALTASSVFSIEEPENYLHPQMQGQFVNIIREILFKEKTNACTLMTTHSETLLNHCKPSELIVVALREGKTLAYRCKNESDLSDEIEKTGFGLGYYYTMRQNSASFREFANALSGVKCPWLAQKRLL